MGIGGSAGPGAQAGRLHSLRYFQEDGLGFCSGFRREEKQGCSEACGEGLPLWEGLGDSRSGENSAFPMAFVRQWGVLGEYWALPPERTECRSLAV